LPEEMMAAKPKRGPGRPKDQGLTERRTEEILSVATEAFAENGLRGTDMQEIADRCGVAKGTVYLYFPGKDELFLATVRRVIDRLGDAIRPVFTEEVMVTEKARRLIEAFIRFFDENPEFVEVLVLERAEFRDRGRLTYFECRDVMMKEWESFFAEVDASGLFRFLPSDRRSAVIGELVYGTIFSARFARSELSVEERREALCALLMGGVRK
jgi:AcrR family transcriptional regulator